MAPPDTLGTLINRQLDLQEWTMADGARITGLSYRHFYRLCHDELQGKNMKADTMTCLERLGLERRTIALAVYGNGSAVPA